METYTILLFVEHEGSDSPTGIGIITGLTMNTNSSMTDAVLVLSTRDSARRRGHCR